MYVIGRIGIRATGFRPLLALKETGNHPLGVKISRFQNPASRMFQPSCLGLIAGPAMLNICHATLFGAEIASIFGIMELVYLRKSWPLGTAPARPGPPVGDGGT